MMFVESDNHYHLCEYMDEKVIAHREVQRYDVKLLI